MPKAVSAGLLMYDGRDNVRVLLAHPGGPFFAKKDEGAWSIPKGLVEAGEDLLTAAIREFQEETGYCPSEGSPFCLLGEVRLKSGKQVHAWGFPGTWEHGRIPDSNSFEMEWPPKSGKKQSFPEIDRAEMFSLEDAYRKINPSQSPFLDRLVEILRATT